ncbi:membrane dipeptidase [Massilia sp. DJPM01]|nr:membrane dipeptidase [Massilia sp. DJPM01]
MALKPSGKALIRGMMKRGMLIDVDHMDRLTFRDTMTMTEQQGYPVISGHVGLVDASTAGGARRHEGNLKDDEVKRILAGGGMASLITLDINGDGLAHIGMLPDFIADLRQPDLAPLMNSAESYIRMWEQAVAKSTSVP